MQKEEKGNYLAGWIASEDREKADETFKYYSANEIGGEFSDLPMGTYSGGGYVADLGRNGTQALDLMARLESSNWVDRQTRAVFVEFLAYNPNTQLYTTVSYAIEFFAGGSTWITPRIYTLKLNKYTGTDGRILVFLQLCCVLFIILYLLHEIKQICYEQVKYFKVYNSLLSGVCSFFICGYFMRIH